MLSIYKPGGVPVAVTLNGAKNAILLEILGSSNSELLKSNSIQKRT